MYIQGNKDFIKKCLNNTDGYLNSPYNTGDYEHLEYLPPSLYFYLIVRERIILQSQRWKNIGLLFIMELSRFIIFEKGFHFLIFISSGRNYFNQVVLNEVTYAKFITVDMLPSSVLYGFK